MGQQFLDGNKVMPIVPERPKRRDIRREGEAERDFSPAVFWGLLVAGLAVLGGCLVVPLWMECQVLAGQSRVLSKRVEEYRMLAAADQEAIEAAKNSVPFNERLMMEELNHQRPGEQVLLRESGQEAVVVGTVVEQDDVGPAWLGAFARRDTRGILLLMSGGLVLFAFVYYPVEGRSGRRERVAKIPVHSIGAGFVRPMLYRR